MSLSALVSFFFWLSFFSKFLVFQQQILLASPCWWEPEPSACVGAGSSPPLAHRFCEQSPCQEILKCRDLFIFVFFCQEVGNVLISAVPVAWLPETKSPGLSARGACVLVKPPSAAGRLVASCLGAESHARQVGDILVMAPGGHRSVLRRNSWAGGQIDPCPCSGHV